MPEPAANGASSGELTQLRQLLIGDQLDQLTDVQERLADPAKRAADLAQVLPEAIRSARPRGLREALEPVIEKAFQSSVRKNPKELVDAIYPIMGPAIRTSISAAIRDFAEALNQIVEKSASFRALRWRIEALVTGKPFSEILLARSLLYSVEQVFLIHRKSGLLLQHAAAKGSVLKDADMISGMLTAIQDFLRDSFADAGQDIETVDAGRFKLWIIYSPRLLLAGAVSGTAPAELRQIFRGALDGIEESLQSEIANFKQDDVIVFEPAQPFLQACLLGQTRAEKRRKPRLWPYFAVVALVIAGVVFYQARQRGRWDSYFESLKRQPGIVVTGIEKHGSSYEVSGLKDPAAADPGDSLRARGLDARKIIYRWQPYLSLDPSFAAARASVADKDFVEHAIIRFETGKSELPVAEAQQIDQLAAVIARLFQTRPNTRITVAGHTDQMGIGEMNAKLSMDRARHVIAALVGPGIPADRLDALGIGDTLPLKTGGSDWDRASNRSVSFNVAD
jgi:OOP family OmpA-OmpF porin